MGQNLSHNHNNNDSQKLQKSQLAKKIQMLEQQQNQYLKNIYEDQRRSQLRESRSSYDDAPTQGFLCMQRRSQQKSHLNQKNQIQWYDMLIERLNEIVCTNSDYDFQWAYPILNRLKTLLKTDSYVTEIKFQQKCDQDHFFLKLNNIEQEIKMDCYLNQKKGRQIIKQRQSEKESMLIPAQRVALQKELERQSKTIKISESEPLNQNNNNNEWNILENDNLAQSESQYLNQQKPFQFTLEDLNRIRDNNQTEIKRYIAKSNEIFDEEIEQVFGKYEIENYSSFSQSMSLVANNYTNQINSLQNNNMNKNGSIGTTVRRYQTDSQLQFGPNKNGNGQLQKQSYNSRNSQVAQDNYKEIMHQQINHQIKILNAMSFFEKSKEFIHYQVTENKKNWLNKILRFFIKIFLQTRNSRDQSVKNIYNDSFSSIQNNNNNNNNNNSNNNNNYLSNNVNTININNNNKQKRFQEDAQISLLQGNQQNMKESIKGVQIIRDSQEIGISEIDINKVYNEIHTFVGIFKNLIKIYYDIPFIVERFDNAKLLLDDVLWNYCTNLIFEFTFNSPTIYSYQLEIQLISNQQMFFNYKKKFQKLANKEPQFYKVKDQFCLNTLTILYIFKQGQKKLKLQKEQLDNLKNNKKDEDEKNKNSNNGIDNINKNGNQSNDSNNIEEESKQQQQQIFKEEEQQKNINNENNKNEINYFNNDMNKSGTSEKISNLQIQYQKLQEAQERFLEREKNSKYGGTLSLLPILSEQDSVETPQDKQKQNQFTEFNQSNIQELQKDQPREVYEEVLSQTNNQNNRINNSQQDQQKEKQQEQDEEISMQLNKQGELTIVRNKSLLAQQIIPNMEEIRQQQQQQQNENERRKNNNKQTTTNINQQPYDRCIYYLKQVMIEQKPIGKLRIILKCFENIQKCVHRFYDQNQSSEKVQIGPEDLMDITVYVLAKSQQYQIINDITLIRAFITKNTEFSDKAGYYLQTLEAAFQYIIETEFNILDENGFARLSFSNSYKSFCGTQEQK